MPLAPALPPDRRTRLLAFAADLLDDLEELDLDTIDGECYWRWCRADLLEPSTVSLPKLPRPIGVLPVKRDPRHTDSPDALEGVFEPEGLFDYLREGLRFVEDILRFSDRLAQRYPRIVWQRLLYGERVAMRAAEVEIHSEDVGGRWRSGVRLRVFSGAWSGRQVEGEIRLHAADHPGDGDVPASVRDDLSLRLRFAFVDEQHRREKAFGEDVSRGSYILVEVPLPLPPEHAIAREYDALVRQEHGWHLELPGSVSRQEKVVAVRTWAIGLLVHEGVPVNSAIDMIHLQLGLEAISQTCFGGDRKRLLERVPEAEPYLYAPTRREERDTRFERSQTLVPEDLTPLPAQPGQPEADLYP